jgi:hypothetical protein
MPLVLNEDKALKANLSGITVSDSGNPNRPVGVWFGHPELEIRQQSYPYITIELIGISEDIERAHRGTIELNYFPEGADTSHQYITDYPIPVNLDYQITTWARQPRHDRQLLSSLIQGQRIPLRFGTLVIPEDMTVRRMDFLGSTKRDRIDENGKRLFSTVFNVRVSAEVLPAVLNQIVPVTQPPQITLNSQSTVFEVLTND